MNVLARIVTRDPDYACVDPVFLGQPYPRAERLVAPGEAAQVDYVAVPGARGLDRPELPDGFFYPARVVQRGKGPDRKGVVRYISAVITFVRIDLRLDVYLLGLADRAFVGQVLPPFGFFSARDSARLDENSASGDRG